MGQLITLYLPDDLYQKAQRLASKLRRPLEEVLVDTIATGLPLVERSQELVDDPADSASPRGAEKSIAHGVGTLR